MKKNYIIPEVETVTIGHVQLLSVSGVGGKGGGIGYGGKDTGGIKEPSARSYDDVFEEWED
ncbi:MAG: hypothetical protein IJ527_01865 [Prevotella sp.]|nr:hypothetical protein [Prevotella sp.]